MKTIFFRALEAKDKASALLAAINNRDSEVERFDVDVATFVSVPRSPFVYWVSAK